MTLPELKPCPIHVDEKPKCIADCNICWSRFYFVYEYTPILARMNIGIREIIRNG